MPSESSQSNSLRVLLCNKFYRPVGGPETVMLKMVRELEARGHIPIPFAMTHPDNLESEYSAYFVSNVDYNTKQSKGVRMVREAVNLVYSREARRNIEKLIADTKPDIAHANNIYHQLSPSILVALKKARIPTVLTLHDGKLLCANMLFLTHGRICEKCAGRRFYHAIVNKCVKDSYASSALCCVEGTIHRWTGLYERNVDLFISPSRFLKGKMVEHGRLPESRVEVLPNFADTESVTPDYRPGDYGRLEPLKGVSTLLDACKELPDFGIWLAGRGPMLEEAEQFCRDHGLDRVRFLGFQTGEALSRLRKESRFIVLPSVCYENCPTVILEAFAAGKPVIASRSGGIPELINHEVDGFLFDPGDAAGLASAVRRLIANPELASEMGKKGRAKVEEHYSIGAYMKSLLGIYERVLNCG
jgi:glycosyltransferase involved in cell wall biosynthesis